MGGSHCKCKDTITLPDNDIQETVQLPTYSEKEKINAKKIFFLFEILHFRNNIKELNRRITNELKTMIAYQTEKDAIDQLELAFKKKFEELFSECRKSIAKYKVEYEVDNLHIQHRNLSIVKEELKNYYISNIEKYHLDLFEKLMQIISEKDEYKVINKEGSKQNDNMLASVATLSKLSHGSRNDLLHINKEVDKNNIGYSLTDREMLSREFDHLFNYSDEKQNSVILNFYIENRGFPTEIKKFINKLFFLKLMKKSEYIYNTKKYLKIAKKEIEKMINEKNIDFIQNEVIVQENYNELFEMINQVEKENEQNILNSFNKVDNYQNIPKSIKKDEIVNNISGNDPNNINSSYVTQKIRRISISNNKNDNLKKFASNIIKVSSPTTKLMNKPVKDLNTRNISRGSSPINTLRLDLREISSNKNFMNSNTIQPQVKMDSDNSKNGSEEEDVVQKLEQIHSKSRPEKSAPKFTRKELLNEDKKFLLGKNYLSNNPNINVEKISNIQFYQGEVDNVNILYSGTGNLIKNYKQKYYYHGTFRMGKKNGYGMLYKYVTDSDFEFYRGEWSNNKQDGFGMMVRIEEKNKKKIFKKGKFQKGAFVYGNQLIIEEKYLEILIEKYEGEIVQDLYTGMGTLNRKILKMSKFDPNKNEVDYDYEYNGNFLNNFENGWGTAKKTYKHLQYHYKYEGNFVNGQMHGEGRIEYCGDYYIESYHGIFENDKTFCTYGKVKFRSGDEYEGFFDENQQKTYLGLYFHYDKNQIKENFFGKFYNDKKEGIGRFVSPYEYKVLVGHYMGGEKNGNFSLTCNIGQESEEDNKSSFVSYSNTYLSSYYKVASTKQSNYNSFINSAPSSPKHSKDLRTDLIKQTKFYYMFENDEIIDKSDKPIKE